jgi:hypothetical protein
MDNEIKDYIESLYSLPEEELSAVRKKVFDKMNEFQSLGLMDIANNFMENIDVNIMQLDDLMSILIGTENNKEDCGSRPGFLQRVKLYSIDSGQFGTELFEGLE